MSTLNQFYREDSGTNTVLSIAEFMHTSSGTPASGLGSKVLLGAENSTGTATSGAELQGYLSTVTAAAEVGVFKLQVRVAGALQDALQVSGAANAATVGSNQTTANLWNTTATTVNAFGAATAVNMITTAVADGELSIGDGTTAGAFVRRIAFNIPASSSNQGQFTWKWAGTQKWTIYNVGNTDNLRVYSHTNSQDEVTFGTTGVTVRLDLAVNGGDLTSTATTFNLLNATVTTLNIGGAATNIAVGATNGGVTFGNAGYYTISIKGGAGYGRQLMWKTGTISRWNLYTDNTAESGSDAGSLLKLDAYTDAGSVIDTVISIVRASGGAVTIARPTTFSTNVTMNGAANVMGDASTDALTFTGRCVLRAVTDAGPMTATGGTAGEIVRNTSDNKFYGCTVTHASAATWVALN